MDVLKFTFGPFSENTYVLVSSSTTNCAIIDPGMYDSNERNDFKQVLESKNLNPTLLLNTHCHIDHVMGNKFVCDEFGLTPQIHEKAVSTMAQAKMAAGLYGLNYDESPLGEISLKEGEKVILDQDELMIYFTPGHAPGHVVFHNQAEHFLIGGDVLFKGSVGRVDLPGSVPADLVKSLQEKVYKLPNNTLVYSGHGPETTVGEEKVSNAFVTEFESRLG